MRNSISSALAVSALAAAVLAASAYANNGNGNGNDDELVPTGKGWGERPSDWQPPGGNAGGKAAPGANGISYHGGPVMTGQKNVYYIYYGNWSASDKSILETLASGLNNSPYFNINTTYYDGNGNHVANSVQLTATSIDNYSRGTALTDSDIKTIVAGKNPVDTNGVYIVLTSPDVNETSGFCTQYCGWHTHGTIGGRDIKYAFVGNPARCPSACTNGTPPPNGSVGADGAASIIAHELEEAATDPDLNAWYDRRGAENADKCAWTFGSTYSNGTGTANVNLGGKDFLIQRNWVNASGGYCAMSY
jgi:hypothetical protein